MSLIATNTKRFCNDRGVNSSGGHNNPKYHLTRENQNNWCRNWYNCKEKYVDSVMFREFSNPLSITDRTGRQKLKKDVGYLKNTVTWFDLTSIMEHSTQQ